MLNSSYERGYQMAKASRKSTPAIVTQEPSPPAPSTSGINIPLLQKIVAATKSPPGFTYASEFDLVQLIALDLVEVNAAFKNAAGNLTVRASSTADDYLENIGANEMTKHEPPVEVVTNATGFEIDNDVPVPAIKRAKGAATNSKYPFDLLEVGQSFHIPAVAGEKDMAKKLASVVVMANRRFSSDIPGEFTTRSFNRRIKLSPGVYQKDANGAEIFVTKTINIPKQTFTKHFAIRSVGADDKRGAGARIFRDK
jgi:hypothetical protein